MRSILLHYHSSTVYMHLWIVDGEAVQSKACDARAAWVGAQDIKLFINSPGGSVTAGMGIYDAMMVSGRFALVVHQHWSLG